MFYFKKIELMNAPGLDVEDRIRKYSIRRHTPLDLQSSATKFPQKDKYFLALESKKGIQITRIKNSLNRYLPKFIIRFDQSDFSFCKIRPSWLSGFLAVFLPLLLLTGFFNSISGNQSDVDLVSLFVVNAVFFSLFFIEYKYAMASLHLALKESDFSFE